MAGKNQARIEVRLPEDLLRQLVYMSEAEGRSVNNQILLLVRNSLAYFERTKGKMDPAKLRALDLSSVLTVASANAQAGQASDAPEASEKE